MRKIENLEEYSYNPVVNWTKKEPTPVNPMEDFRRETAARVMCVLVGQTDITRLIEKDVCERITDRAIYFTDELIKKLNQNN